MRNPEEIAKQVTEMIAKESYKFFRDKRFKKMNQFEKIDQAEQG